MKKILAGIGIALTLLIAIALIAPSFVDWNAYRFQIAQKVKDATGRKLHIGGDIDFSVLPTPVLQVTDVHLANAEGASQPTMVSIRQLDVSVALLPLLGGTVHVQNIRLIDPLINLEILADGRGNWDLSTTPVTQSSTLETSPQDAAPQLDISAESQAKPLPIQVDDFIIENAMVVFEDPAKGIREEIKDINSRFAIADLNGPFEAAGTLNLRNMPIGFNATVGQIVHGRTASFASQLHLAHGNTTLKTSGTFVNLAQGPQIKAKVDVAGQSLAGLINAFQPSDTQPGALNRAFGLDGEISLEQNRVSFGDDGLSLHLGEDQGRVLLDLDMSDLTTVRSDIHFNRVNADIWAEAQPYKVPTPAALPLVIEPKGATQTPKNQLPRQLQMARTSETDSEASSTANPTFTLPKDIDGEIALSIDALTFKGKAVRQIQTAVSISQGDLALERGSAILPGAGEVSLVGIAGERDGALAFDGSLDVNIAHLRGLLDWLAVDTAQIPADRLGQLLLSSEIALTPKQLTLQNLSTTVDGSTLSGAVILALRARPSFGATLHLDRVNLEAYLPSHQVLPAKTETQQSAQTAPSAQQNTSQKSPKILQSLKILDLFDANVNISVDQLTYQQQAVRSLYLEGGLFDSALTLKNAGIKDFAGLKVGLSGGVKKTDKGVFADNLQVSLSGKKLEKAAKLVGLDQSLNWSRIGAVDSSISLNGNILAPDFTLDLQALGTQTVLSGKADLLPFPKANATLNSSIADLDRVTRGLSLGYRPSGKVGPISVQSDIRYTPNTLQVTDIQASLNNTPISGDISYTIGPRPKADVKLKTGVLVLDPLLPRPATKASTSPKKSSGATQQAQSGTSTSGESRWSKDPIDVSVLKSLDMNADIRMEGLRHKQVLARQITVLSQLQNGVLTLEEGSANVFEGKLSVQSTLNAQNGLSMATKTTVTNVNIAKAMAATASKSIANGHLSFSGDVTSQGVSEYDLVSNLNGQVQVNAQRVSAAKSSKGSIVDLINFLSVLSGRNADKGLADITIASNLNNGVATLSNAGLTSTIATGEATGTLDLVNWLADISGTLNVQQNALVGLLAQQANIKSSYPFAVKGNLDSPNIKLDSGGISSGGGLSIPLSDKLEKKGVGTLVRGILGAAGVKTTAPTTSENNTPSQPSTAPDGTLAPPPPPSGSNGSTTSQQPSKEQLIFEGLNQLFKR